MSWDPEINRQDAIETACHNAIRAIHREAESAARQQRSADPRLALAAALEELHNELTADRPSTTLPFTLKDCIKHLRLTAAPPHPLPAHAGM